MKVAIVGGGAAGFFAALSVTESHPEADVTLFEKSNKTLAKVKVSGGGRCNVTNSESDIQTLAVAYPRGGRFMRKLLKVFSTPDTRSWFEQRGVPLMTEEDGRVFPQSQDSQTIIDCLRGGAQATGVTLHLKDGVEEITPKDGHFSIKSASGTHIFDKVIVTTGGHPSLAGLDWLAGLGHTIKPPVPSLFTFNMPEEGIVALQGVSRDPVQVSIQGSKLKNVGPLLITHWGMSGPAILRLSAFGARELAERGYQFNIQVNWMGQMSYEDVRVQIETMRQSHPQRSLIKVKPPNTPERLWEYLLRRSGLDPTKPWQELGSKQLNRLVNTLASDIYKVSGKTTFKEEFVTCGGVSLSQVDHRSMESKLVPGLYFAGEVLDIDGITGGFNFQAAWTTAFIASKLSKEA